MTRSTISLAHVEGLPFDMNGVEWILDHVLAQADQVPNKSAIILGDIEYTYRELSDLSLSAAHWLREQGINSGDRIAYLGKNNPLYMVVLLACMLRGIVLVPLNWRCAAPEIEFILEDSGAKLIVFAREFEDVCTQADTKNRQRVCVDDPSHTGFEAKIKSMKPSDRTPANPDVPCLQLYTSGTTGKPKGVLVNQYALTAARRMEEQCGGFDDWGTDEVLLSPLPLFHIGGTSWLLCGLYWGATTVLMNEITPTVLLDLCLSKQVTRTFMVPMLVRALLAEMKNRNVSVPSLKAIHYGAAPMDAALLEGALENLGCRFLQYFGMTEMTGTITILIPQDHDLSKPWLLGSVGKVLPGGAIEIRNPEGQVLSVDEPGEIWIKSPSRMIEYVGLPKVMSETIIDGWYRSGDGGKLDQGGYLYLTDRIKDMIVSGGENIYPVEVEKAIHTHEAVQECAVFGLPDSKWGEKVCVAIEKRQGHSVEAKELQAYLRHSLAGYKIPRVINFTPSLPRTASGKVQRAKVRQQFLASEP